MGRGEAGEAWPISKVDQGAIGSSVCGSRTWLISSVVKPAAGVVRPAVVVGLGALPPPAGGGRPVVVVHHFDGPRAA